MKAMIAIRRHRSSLPMVAAAGALALLGAVPALSGASPEWMKQQVENSRRENQQRQERQRGEQQRPPREQAPPRSQPDRPPGGNFAGAPRPPQDNPGGGDHRPPGNGGGNANYNRPPRGNGGNDSNYNRPPNNNGGNWRPDYSRPPTNAGRPGYNPGYRPGYNPGYRPGYSPGYRPGYRPPPRYVPRLPSGYARHYWNGSPYYYSSGYWYRPYGTSYALVTAPYGLFMSYLPGTYSSFWYGSSRYFYVDNTYYLYDNTRRGYVVTQSPYGEDSQQDSAGSAADDQLYVYPARGQSEQQTADDRYECHRWAVEQTGFDPVESDYDADRRGEYLRAVTACLTGRGYTVR